MQRKLILITVFTLMALALFGLPLNYIQKVVAGDPAVNIYDIVTNTSSATSNQFIVEADILETPGEIMTTEAGNPDGKTTVNYTQLRINRVSTNVVTTVQCGWFPTPWVVGNTIQVTVKYIGTAYPLATGETVTFTEVIPVGVGSAIMDLTTPEIVPPLQPDQTLTIASDPTGQPIWVNGGDTGFVTPHDFLNPVEADVYTINNPAYTWAPLNYTVPAGFTTQTVTFIGTLIPADTYTLTVTSTPTGIEIFKGGATTGFTTEHVFGPTETEADLFGVYTLAAAPEYFHWEPLQHDVQDIYTAIYTARKANGLRTAGTTRELHNLTIDFQQVATQYTFTFTGLPAGATINGGTVFTFTGTAAELFAMTFDILAPGFEPILGYVITPATLLDGGDEIVMDPIVDTWTLNVISTPEGQEIWKNNVYTGFVTPHAFTNEDQTALYGTYTLPVVAGFVWCPLEHIVNVDTWNTKADYPATIEFLQQQIYTWTVLVLDLNTSSPIEGASIWFDDGVNPPTVVATTIVNGTYTFTCPGDYPGAGTYYVTAAGYNVWDPINVVQTVETMTENLPNSTFYGDWEDQVPVELSSFTATLTGQFYVQLSWTSQTETQMMGYRVYRNTSAEQSTSELIDNPMIPATNTSTAQNYTVVDDDVLIGQTYYYWLEAVDYNSSSFHGPVSVTVTGNVPPVLPEVTTMRNAYPNPFKANGSTNIEVSLKAGDTGTLTIYNVQGQLVKTVSLTEGNHMVNWNGRDSRGNACGSGIYFYKLSTQSMNQTKKMVIVK